MVRRVLVVGEPSPSNLEVVEALRSHALQLTLVVRQSDAMDLVGAGEPPHAVLLLDSSGRQPDCFVDCECARLPDCRIDCIRARSGLERIPVMFYSPEDGREPPPEELAALIAAAAAMSEV